MKGLAVALLALATRAAAEVTVEAKPQITYFTTLFASGNYGHHAWKTKELISPTARLSLASVPNLGRLTILTHASYRGLSALRDLASPAVSDEVTVLPDHDVGLVTHPNNWVLRVELFKYQFA